MSLCFRTIPSKFTPFVNTRKNVTQLDHQLTKQRKSTFLEEFLGKKITEPVVESFQNKPLDLSIESLNRLNTPESVDLLRKYGFLYNSKFKSNVKNSQLPINEKQSYICFDTKNISLIQNEICNPADSVKYIQLHNHKQGTIHCDSKVHIIQSDLETKSLVYNISNQTDQQVPSRESPNQRPSQEQLQKIFKTLEHDLPRLFIKPFDYTIYAQDIIFENNIRDVTSRGLFAYIRQISLLKIIGHLKFAYVKLGILKITLNPEDDSIKVRWQIQGITTMKVIFKFWKFKIWKIKEALQETQVWQDGFSTFYVNGNGQIYKHVADKMMPDQDKASEKVKPGLISKLTLIVGLSKTKFLNQLKLILSRKLPSAKNYGI